MARVRIDDRGVTKLTFDDGSTYGVRGGYAELPADKARMIRQANVGAYAPFSSAPVEGKTCSHCGFQAYAWSRHCGRCGTPFEAGA